LAATQRGASVALRNGPRFRVVDTITKYSAGHLPTADLGGIAMHPDAVLQLGSLDPQPYAAHAVERNTVFGYRAGRQIYELRAADGSVSVMQSWSQQDDPTIDAQSLAGLGAKLDLPGGWSFDTRILASPLRIVTTATPALVLQDGLGNSYSKES
jgi:hypothetical protein